MTEPLFEENKELLPLEGLLSAINGRAATALRGG